MSGLAFTPDMKSMFVNMQHPGEMGGHPNKPTKSDGSFYDDDDLARDPLAFSKWPEPAGGRPRSATVVVRRADGRKILG